jgi:hypothetical protein
MPQPNTGSSFINQVNSFIRQEAVTGEIKKSQKFVKSELELYSRIPKTLIPCTKTEIFLINKLSYNHMFLEPRSWLAEVGHTIK